MAADPSVQHNFAPDRWRDGRFRIRTDLACASSATNTGFLALTIAASALVAGACSRDARVPRQWDGTIDTLAGGVVVVRNTQQGVWEPTAGWSITEDVRIGSVTGSGPDAFGAVTAVVEDDLGRIWVLDRQAVQIQVFDTTGDWVRTVGREGAGPEEFRRPLDITRGPDGNMWVVDPGNARYSVFDTAGTLVTSHRRLMSSSALPWPGGFDDQGRLYDYASTLVPERARSLVRMRFDQPVLAVDTIQLPDPPGEEAVVAGAIPGGFASYGIPFGSTYVWSFVPDGRVLFAMTGEYRIHFAPLGGQTVRIVERQVTPTPITPEARRDAADRTSRNIPESLDFDASMIPEHYPVIDALFVDDRDHLWVRVHVPQPTAETVTPGLRLVPWDVFDPDGRYLGRLEGLPPSMSVRGNSITGFTVDELGVSYVLRYRIQGRAD